VTRIYLDPTGSAPARPKHTVVTSDVDFWRAALQGTPLHVRGKLLCRWAETFYEGRCQQVEVYAPPFEALRDLCAELSVAQAQELTRYLGGRLAELPEPLELPDVVSELFSQPFLREQLSVEHAAQYLLWRLEAQPTEAEDVLLRTFAADYRSRQKQPEAQVYTVANAAEAYEMLKMWLGLEVRAEVWEPFPQPLSQSVKRKLQRDLKGKITADPKLFITLQLNRADKLLLGLAAEITAEYMQLYPEQLTQNLFTQLSRSLSANTREALKRSLPVAEPPPTPQQAEGMLEWFKSAYLPYRTWPRHDEAVVERLAQQFAETYLRLYAEAVSGSADQIHLSWNKTRELKTPGHRAITLLVVLDGLGYADIDVFWEELSRLDAQERLVVKDTQIAFGPLPSITRCSKPALERGISPYRAEGEPTTGIKLTKDDKLSETLQAATPGEVVIWSLQEPDSTYHDSKNLGTARDMAHAALGGVAKRLLEHTKDFDQTLQLTIIVTTDHGRLLGSSSRTQTVPAGMNAEGRAATGVTYKNFPETGFLIEGDVVFLDGERFRMAEDAAIIVTNDSFLTRDGKHGTDAFPHGGLYPEEVLIPWLVLSRDLTFVPLTASLSGSGEANRTAELMLSVMNPNSAAMRLEALTLDFLSSSAKVTETVAPMREAVITVPVTLPSTQAAEAARAQLSYRLPDGSLQQVEVGVAISSREMYSQSNALEDLL
jgi:hypothetical protein